MQMYGNIKMVKIKRYGGNNVTSLTRKSKEQTIKDLVSDVDESIANVGIEFDEDTYTLTSKDPLALMTAVCTALSNGGEFVSGTDTTATLRHDAKPYGGNKMTTSTTTPDRCAINSYCPACDTDRCGCEYAASGLSLIHI